MSRSSEPFSNFRFRPPVSITSPKFQMLAMILSTAAVVVYFCKYCSASQPPAAQPRSNDHTTISGVTICQNRQIMSNMGAGDYWILASIQARMYKRGVCLDPTASEILVASITHADTLVYSASQTLKFRKQAKSQQVIFTKFTPCSLYHLSSFARYRGGAKRQQSP